MNGEGPQVNGQRLPNGTPTIKPPPPPETKPPRPPDAHLSKSQMNGVVDSHHQNGGYPHKRDYQEAPQEPLQLVDQEHYLPIATLVSRSAQTCWNDLYRLVDQLSAIEVPAQAVDVTRGSSYAPPVTNQTKPNLDKKDRILNFANDQKANFIKLMVLLQWSKRVKDVSKTISLNYWLHLQREQYNLACFDFYMLKTEATEWQLPNPDIRTAGEVLALGKIPSLPHLGYRPVGKLSKAQIISTLRRLNNLLTARLALDEEIPAPLSNYHVHDGRVTLRVADEFEVDLSVLEDNVESPFRMVDLRFLFTPRPRITDELRPEIERLTDSEISRNGLRGCYEFLHELTLSNKLAEYYKQAVELSRRQWAGQVRVELLHRNLIIQYWTERPMAKSWIEIGIYRPRNSAEQTQLCSTLGIRWFRESKHAESFEVELDHSNLSLASIMAQVVAQHIAQILDSIYDKLTPNALFSSGALALEESTSFLQPEDCSLEIQTTKHTVIVLTMNPVTGLMVVSPASEKTNRLQLELNRSKSVVEDFVPKFLNFRCAVAEAQVLGTIGESSWRGLLAFKPALADLRTLFGPSVVRASFFRYPLWSEDYLLAIVYRPTGDSMFIIEMPSGSAALTSSRIVHTQPIRFSDDLSPAFFDSFAEYASGVVALDNISRQFKQTNHRHIVAALPEFGPKYSLPSLSFDTRGSMQALASSSSSENTARIRFVRIDATRRKGKVLVQLKCHAPAEVLRQIMASSSDSGLELALKDRQILFHLDIDIGQTKATDIIQHVKRLTDVVTAVQLVESLPWLRLVSVSIQAMTLAYKCHDSTERDMKIDFGSATTPARVQFLPLENNPHAVLAPAMSGILRDTGKSLSSHLSDLMASLSLISPVLTCLYDLQQSKPESAPESEKVRIHLLVRQPTIIALQFYVTKGPKDTTPQHTSSRLLARFEILPFQNAKSSFVLRPAEEELRSYKRASFASDAMRAKVKELFFQVASSGDETAEKSEEWMRFDSGAVFLADRPRPVLEGLYKLMVEFAQNPNLAIKDDNATNADGSTASQMPAPASGKPNGTTPQKAVPKTPQQQNQKPLPNGLNRPRPKQGNKPAMNPQGKEVITLD